MADKVRPAANNKSRTPKSSSSTFKWVLIILLSFLLVGMGIGAAAYFKLKNSPELVNAWKIYEYPLIGQLFPRPKTNFDTVELPPETNQALAQLVMPPNPLPTADPALQNPPISAADIELAKQKTQQETAKRISKLARLYGGMKPEEAAPILNRLDDDTIIAILGKMEDDQFSKLLPLFEPQRAARLTQLILRGSNNR